MTIKVTREDVGDAVIIGLEGSVDIYSSPELRGELKVVLDNQIPRLVVDLEHVTFVDSSGLATLIEALQKMTAYQGQLVRCSLSTAVRGVFELANLDSIFQIKANRDSALGS